MYKLFTGVNGVGTLLFDYVTKKVDTKSYALILQKRASDYLSGKTTTFDAGNIDTLEIDVIIPAGTKVYFEIDCYNCTLLVLDNTEIAFDEILIDLYDYNKRFAINTSRGIVVGAETKFKILNDINIKTDRYTHSKENEKNLNDFSNIVKKELDVSIEKLKKDALNDVKKMTNGIKNNVRSCYDVVTHSYGYVRLDKQIFTSDKIFVEPAKDKIFMYSGETFFDNTNDHVELDIQIEDVIVELVDV